MAYIYSCGNCNAQYTVYEEGDYVCKCGNTFHYPVMAPVMQSNLSATDAVYMDSSSRSMKRSTKYHNIHSRAYSFTGGSECPLARGSLICAVLSLLFFGILAPPALIMGFAARVMIADKRYHYTGDSVALSGIIIATISFSAWGIWFISLL
jgi:hypothetical protein